MLECSLLLIRVAASDRNQNVADVNKSDIGGTGTS